ncbi:AAA family ATPase [Streptomyces collinus]|uniref:helix-turn-helix transcriptional regulator n=1 Tax=Streptomyces collinus TaxID=42684 RepID=UPI0036E8CFCA
MSLLTSELIERSDEFAAILKEVRSLQAHPASSGRILLIRGPAGIGKTRLLKELQLVSREAGMTVVSARASHFEGDFAYGVAHQLFDAMARTASQDLWDGPAAEARKLFISSGNASDVSSGDFALLNGLFWLTVNICHNNPMVMVIDDLQWCDIPTLRYLQYLTARLDDLRILIGVSLRAGERKTDEALIKSILSRSFVRSIEPTSLTLQGTTRLLGLTLSSKVDAEFSATCHEITAGNPLFVRQLARTLVAEHIDTNKGGVERLREIGPRAVAKLVASRLQNVPVTALDLARAIAILGDGAELSCVLALTERDDVAMSDISLLEQGEIVHAEDDGALKKVSFVHPLVRSAVYEAIPLAEQVRLHYRAARLLVEAGAPREQAARHLLQVPPSHDSFIIETLRAASNDAMQAGSPEAALNYLKRTLNEVTEEAEYKDLLVEIGSLATLVDMASAAAYLGRALNFVTDNVARARISFLLGIVLNYTHHVDEALKVLEDAEATLSDDQTDLKARVQSYILNTTIVEPNHAISPERYDYLRDAAGSYRTVGQRLLGCSLAFHEMRTSDRRAVSRAQLALGDNHLIDEAPGEAPAVSAWVVLIAADRPEVMCILDSAIARGRRYGAIRDLAPAFAFRALAWLYQGYLTEAESDAKEAFRAIDAAGVDTGRAWTAPIMAEALAEMGRMDEAAAALEWACIPEPLPEQGNYWLVLESKAKLARLRGDYEEALANALLSGRYATSAAIDNPALCGWRSEAALALHLLGRKTEAQELSEQDLHSARQWGSPRALGRSLRVAGLNLGGRRGVDMLSASVDLLKDSPARLEYATALASLGALFRRLRRPSAARPLLREAWEIANSCSAVWLTETVRAELAAAGESPCSVPNDGKAFLTPSEHRIALMAVDGLTNRQIAQRLYVTPKTVEVHLSSVYRKLNISGRRDLSEVMSAPERPG